MKAFLVARRRRAESYWRSVYPRWVPFFDCRNSVHLTDGFETRDIFSDVVWCTYCGSRMHGLFGRQIAASTEAHRESCRGGESVWVGRGAAGAQRQ